MEHREIEHPGGVNRVRVSRMRRIPLPARPPRACSRRSPLFEPGGVQFGAVHAVRCEANHRTGIRA